MSRRRNRRRHSDVELNLAAMLDMAFQLLTFFILTFHPSPIEGELQLRLPPPLPATEVKPLDDAAAADTPGSSPAYSLVIRIESDPQGNVSQLKLGPRVVFQGAATEVRLHELDRLLRDLFSIQRGEYEQVLIRVGPELHYQELMKVVDVCTRQKLPDGKRLQKISFQEIPDAEAAR